MVLLEGRAEATAGEFTPLHFKNLLSAYISGKFTSTQVINTLRAYAEMGRIPGEELMGRTEATAGEFDSKDVARKLRACVKMGRMPGERLMGLLEEQAEARSEELDSDNVSMTLWSYAKMVMNPCKDLLGCWRSGRRRYQGSSTRTMFQGRCGRMRRWGGSRGNG
jgi:hypothetical protein